MFLNNGWLAGLRMSFAQAEWKFTLPWRFSPPYSVYEETDISAAGLLDSAWCKRKGPCWNPHDNLSQHTTRILSMAGSVTSIYSSWSPVRQRGSHRIFPSYVVSHIFRSDDCHFLFQKAGKGVPWCQQPAVLMMIIVFIAQPAVEKGVDGVLQIQGYRVMKYIRNGGSKISVRGFSLPPGFITSKRKQKQFILLALQKSCTHERYLY